MDTPVWAAPGCTLPGPAHEDPGRRDDGGENVDDPERDRVPDHPEVVASHRGLVASVDDDAAGELQHADQRQDHPVPRRQQGVHVQRRRQRDEFPQCP